jgi:hypothetical protein
MPDSLADDVLKNAAESPFSATTDNTSVTQHRLADLVEADRYIESKKAARRAFPVKRSVVEPPGAV